jgi:type I restriction enzyme, S subunit
MVVAKRNWPTKRLSALADFRNGVNYNKSSFGEGVKVVGVSDFQDYSKPRYEELGQINPDGIVTERNILRDGDIIFVRSNGNRELIGRSLFIEKPLEEITHSAFTIRLRFTSPDVYPKFYAYCFRTPLIRQALTAQGGGTNINNLNQDILNALEVPHPPLDVQQRIAGILSAYDELIENSQRRIRILESMARALYREWFVHFRFPGHESVPRVPSPLGKIPQGWEVKKLESLMADHIGGGWGKDVADEDHTQAAWVIRGTDIPAARSSQVTGVPHRFHTASNLRSRRLAAGDILFEVSGGSKGQPVGRTLFITPHLLSALDGDVICASFCKRVRPKVDAYGSELLYLSFLEGYESGEIEQYQVQSTGISNFKWTEYIANIERVIPPAPLRARFHEFVAPLFTQIAVLGLKIQNLRRTRDLLLPRLLSGQVAVGVLSGAISDSPVGPPQ